MEQLAAVIDQGVVVNVIVVQGASDAWVLVPVGQPVSIGWTYDGTTFAPPAKPIEVVRTAAAQRVNSECAALITAGFTSSALGAPYSYTATLEDQANLLALLIGGAGGHFTCVDGSGIKARVLHTDAQLRAVLRDGAIFKDALLARARVAKDAIASATTVAEIEAIVW